MYEKQLDASINAWSKAFTKSKKIKIKEEVQSLKSKVPSLRSLNQSNERTPSFSE